MWERFGMLALASEKVRRLNIFRKSDSKKKNSALLPGKSLHRGLVAEPASNKDASTGFLFDPNWYLVYVAEA